MKDFDTIMNAILAEEMPKINKVMAHMAKRVQTDLYKKTCLLLDAYYDGYTRPPRKYVRIDERSNKSGRSLMRAIKYDKKSIGFLEEDDSVSFTFGNLNGYVSGIKFSDGYFESETGIEHKGAGIEEFDIVENFLFSGTDGIGNHEKMQRNPSAAAELYSYLDNYDQKIDKYYKDACRLYRK